MYISFIFLIFFTIEIINISACNYKKLERINNGVAIGSSCQTYDDQTGVCTESVENCRYWTKSQRKSIEKSKCSNKAGVCCMSNSKMLLPSSNECGKLTSWRMIGGSEIELGVYPWMTFLKYNYTREGSIKFGCSGSLINKRYVLTAAHCLNVSDTIILINEVRLGKWDTNSNTDCISNGINRVCNDNPLDIGIEQSISHPYYDRFGRINDIALLRLNRNVEYTGYIKPICLPFDNNINGKKFKNIVLSISGGGPTENGYRSYKELDIKVTGKKDSKCNRALDVKLVKTQICAGNDVQGACGGDSGGPLMYQNYNGYYAVGIVSYGDQQECNLDGIPDVYTRVDEYLDWILDTIRK